MTSLNPINAAAHLLTLEHTLDERRHDAATFNLLAQARSLRVRSARPVRRALQLRAARLHGAG